MAKFVMSMMFVLLVFGFTFAETAEARCPPGAPPWLCYGGMLAPSDTLIPMQVDSFESVLPSPEVEACRWQAKCFNDAKFSPPRMKDSQSDSPPLILAYNGGWGGNSGGGGNSGNAGTCPPY